MDSKDRQILRALQQDGRMTNLELAERVNLSPSPCLRRLRNLEASGAIRGFHADVDRAAYALAEVLECYMLTGGTDYFLKVVVSGLDAYEDFIRHRIHTIGGIGSIDTSFVYGTVKRSGVFPRID